MIDVVTETLTRTWTEIRKRHPDVPDVAICVTSGASQAKCGSRIWENTRLLEVDEKVLGRDPEGVLAWLLHQAAHELADSYQPSSHQPSREVNRTAQHDQAFHGAAVALGLEVPEPDVQGRSPVTSMPRTLIASYGFAILRIRQACANLGGTGFRNRCYVPMRSAAPHPDGPYCTAGN